MTSDWFAPSQPDSEDIITLDDLYLGPPEGPMGAEGWITEALFVTPNGWAVNVRYYLPDKDHELAGLYEIGLRRDESGKEGIAGKERPMSQFEHAEPLGDYVYSPSREYVDECLRVIQTEWPLYEPQIGGRTSE